LKDEGGILKANILIQNKTKTAV